MRVWLPVRRVGRGHALRVWMSTCTTASGEPPSTIEDVEVYVPPYMVASPGPFEVMRSMPALRWSRR